MKNQINLSLTADEVAAIRDLLQSSLDGEIINLPNDATAEDAIKAWRAERGSFVSNKLKHDDRGAGGRSKWEQLRTKLDGDCALLERLCAMPEQSEAETFSVTLRPDRAALLKGLAGYYEKTVEEWMDEVVLMNLRSNSEGVLMDLAEEEKKAAR